MTQTLKLTSLDYSICFLPEHHHQKSLNSSYFNQKNERQTPAVPEQHTPILLQTFPNYKTSLLYPTFAVN